MEWEVKPISKRFNGNGTEITALWQDNLASGAPVNEEVTGLAAGTPFRWRVRLHYHPLDSIAFFGSHGRWVSPADGASLTHFRTAAATTLPAAGRMPGEAGIPGPGLTLAPATGGEVALSWQPSCHAGDVDYEVYEGNLGDFSSHVPRLCSTGGAVSATFLPAGGARYYLVVPANGASEGSYGRRADGSPRPRSAAACLPQVVAAAATCP